MTSFWEGQASAAEEGIFMVCYSNWVGECVCVFLKFLSLFAFLLSLKKKNKPQNPTSILLSFLSYLLFPPSALRCCLYVLLLLFIALSVPCSPPLGAKLFQSWDTWLALRTTCCSQCEAFVLPLSGTIWIGILISLWHLSWEHVTVMSWGSTTAWDGWCFINSSINLH